MTDYLPQTIHWKIRTAVKEEWHLMLPVTWCYGKLYQCPDFLFCLSDVQEMDSAGSKTKRSEWKINQGNFTKHHTGTTLRPLVHDWNKNACCRSLWNCSLSFLAKLHWRSCSATGAASRDAAELHKEVVKDWNLLHLWPKSRCHTQLHIMDTLIIWNDMFIIHCFAVSPLTERDRLW